MRTGVLVLLILVGGLGGALFGMLLGLGALALSALGPLVGAGSVATTQSAAMLGALTGASIAGVVGLLLTRTRRAAGRRYPRERRHS